VTTTAALVESFPLLVSLLMVMMICMVVFSAAVFQFEPGTNHTLPSNDPETWFMSVPSSFWWGLVTLTGVGYGDQYPMFFLGRIVAVLASLVGVIIVAVPIEVIGRYFTWHYRRHIDYGRIEREVEVGGRLDVKRLMGMFTELGSRGLLKVHPPESEEEVRELVALYDEKGNLRLEHEEWCGLISDLVMDKGDHTSASVRKSVRELYEVKRDLKKARAELKEAMSTRQMQMGHLLALAKQRYPNGTAAARPDASRMCSDSPAGIPAGDLRLRAMSTSVQLQDYTSPASSPRGSRVT